MPKILYAKRSNVKRYAQGANFVKDQYIPTEIFYYAKLVGGAFIDLTKEKIWNMSGRKGASNVSQKDLDLCRGKNIDL